MIRILVLAAVILVAAGCTKSDSPSGPAVASITDLLPKDNEISGWPRKGGAGASWRATSAAELQAAIDGGAEIYTNHGFVEAAMQSYTGSVNQQAGVDCEVQIYDQASAVQATAVFEDPNMVYPAPIAPDNPPSALAQIRKDIFSHTMKFVKGRYFVQITLTSADDKAQAVLEMYANNVAAKIR